MLEILLYAFPAAMVFAAVSDLGRYEIPNWLSIFLILAFLALALGLGMAWDDVAARLGVGLLIFGLGAVLFALGALGGGDVKLLAASSIWVGWPDLILYLVAVALFGGLVSLVLVILRWLWRRRGADRESIAEGTAEGTAGASAGATWWHRLMSPKQGVPYGLAIGLGGLLLWFVRIRTGLAQ